jgi:hypothetical protein
MTRLARGSMPWPVRLDGRPAARGSLTTETPIAAGARLRLTAWWRRGPTGEAWLSLECEPYAKGGRRPTTADKTNS